MLMSINTHMFTCIGIHIYVDQYKSLGYVAVTNNPLC